MSSPPRVQRVILYSRVSHTDDGSAKSVASQRTELRAWAAREGWEVVEDLHEQGSASAYAKRSRQAWPMVLRAIRERRADALLTWESSRATRDMAAFLELSTALIEAEMLWGYGGTLHNPADPDDQAMSSVQAVFAQLEAAKTRARVQRGVRSAAEKGMPHGRHLYGYQRLYEGTGDARSVTAVVEDPQRGPVVREAARRVLAGEPLRRLALEFNDRGLPVAATDREEREGLLWTAPRIRQMLQRPGYAGLRTHQGEIIGEAAWEPLIERAQWDELQRLLADPRRRSGRGEHRAQHLLSGIARCAVCGSPLICRATRSGQRVRNDGTRPPTRRYRVYACTAGATVRDAGFHVSMSADLLDKYVGDIIVRRLSRPDVLESLGGTDDDAAQQRAALHQEIDGYRAHLEAVREQAAQLLRTDLLIDQEARLQPRIQAAEKKLRELAGVDPTVRRIAEAADVRESWEAADIETRRHLVRELMVVSVKKRVSAGRKGMDPRRVEITWVS